MRVFLVTITPGEEAAELARNMILECGAQDYAAAEEFQWDGVQDPYRAVLEADPIVWFRKSSPMFRPGMQCVFHGIVSEGVF
jgi:hypothetical protein